MHLPYIIFYDIGVLDKKIFFRKISVQKKKNKKKRTFFPKWLFSIYFNGHIQFWHTQPMVAQSILRGTGFEGKNIESTLPEDPFTHKFQICGPREYAYIPNYLHLKEGVFLHFDTLDFFSPNDVLCQVWLKLADVF